VVKKIFTIRIYVYPLRVSPQNAEGNNCQMQKRILRVYRRNPLRNDELCA